MSVVALVRPKERVPEIEESSEVALAVSVVVVVIPRRD